MTFLKSLFLVLLLVEASFCSPLYNMGILKPLTFPSMFLPTGITPFPFHISAQINNF